MLGKQISHSILIGYVRRYGQFNISLAIYHICQHKHMIDRGLILPTSVTGVTAESNRWTLMVMVYQTCA